MAVDYRRTPDDASALRLADGELAFVQLTTTFCMGGDERATETTALVSFGRSGDLCRDHGEWNDALTQTRALVGRCAAWNGAGLAVESIKRFAQAQLLIVSIETELSVPIEDIAVLIRHTKAKRGLPVLVVGGDASQRQVLSDADGFVGGIGTTISEIAVAVLYTFHLALSAAHRLTCVDLEEALSAAGSAREPAVLVEAVWQREPLQKPALSAAAANILRGASVERVLLVPSARGLVLAEVRELVAWVRGVTGKPSLDVVIAGPVDCAGGACVLSNFGVLRLVVRHREP